MLDNFKASVRGALKSWTMWFNTTCALIAYNWDWIISSLPGVREFMPQNMYGVLMLAAFGVNVLLRMKTNKPLSQK